MDTIFAEASAPGKAGVAVIRLSGRQAFTVAEQLTGTEVPGRRPVLRTIKHPHFGQIDTGLVIGFPEGGSFTGEDVVEFQVHGSRAVVSALLESLGTMAGLRLAEPGEFTRRALENGQLDLTQVEGLADLIEAETEFQRRQALRVADGALREKAESVWRSALIRATALLEATIDFADEDVPTDVMPEVLGLIDTVSKDLRREEAGSRIAERIRDGFEVAIVGRPNAGKSTLLNALAGREAAITSEMAGTTRDVIEVRMDLDGLPVTLLDTAGLRESSDPVERIGVDRARERALAADLRVFLLLDEADEPALSPGLEDVVVVGRGDLYHGSQIAVSGKTGAGIDALVTTVSSRLAARAVVSSTVIRARQRQSISRALTCITAARDEADQGEARVEYASEELHRAILELDALVGRVDVEHVLDEIFASFCLGK